MVKKTKTALFIGRFQPFHNAHLSDIKLELREGNYIIIAIGSSQESHTSLNPFTYKERKDMIEKTLRANHIKTYQIVAVPDINNDAGWVDYVREIIPNFDIVYTGNDFTEKLFREKGVQVRKIELIPNINATEIRKRIVEGNNWKELVPEEVGDYLVKINGIERLKNINN